MNCQDAPTLDDKPSRARAGQVAAALLGALMLLAGAPDARAMDGSVLQLSAAASAEDAVRQVRMERNKSKFIKTDYRVKRVSVGDPSIVDVLVLSPREIQLVPKAIGATNVVLWDPQGQPQAALEISVGSTFSHVEADLRRVLGSPDIRVDSAGNSVVLTGSVSSTLAAEQALTITRAVVNAGSGKGRNKKKQDTEVINLLEIGGGQQVMIEVTLAEMSRSLRREIGTNIAGLIGDDVQFFSFVDTLLTPNAFEFGGGVNTSGIDLADAVNLFGQFSAGSGIYSVAIKALKENGIGKILAEPTLIARSGEEASFLAGGEIPIPVVQSGNSDAVTIEFKEFGVGVAFTPTVLSEERIHLEVAPEVSEPDFTFGTQSGGTRVPGFLTRRASTSIELGDGETFAIAGLLSDRVTEAAAKYPILGEIPILGMLFRSVQFQKEQTELVILVTPRLVTPVNPGDMQLPTDYFIEPNEFEFYLMGWLEGAAEKESESSASSARVEPPIGLIGDAGHLVGTSPEGETR